MWPFKHKKYKYRVWDALPNYSREVIVNRHDKTIPPFSAYIKQQYNSWVWELTSYRDEGKILYVFMDDEWKYIR